MNEWINELIGTFYSLEEKDLNTLVGNYDTNSMLYDSKTFN